MTEQDGFLLAMTIKPLVAIAFFLVAAILGRLILSMLPEGKLKKLLSRRVGP